MTDEEIDALCDFLDRGDYRYRDVLIDGREHTAVLYEGRWVLMEITRKFEGGLPYFDTTAAREVEEQFLFSLEEQHWSSPTPHD